DIVNILSHDKCAAGSGEFFIQQIERLGLKLDEAIEKSKQGKNIDLASRCSVYCKSDITHKLNKGEASIEDILTSVIYSMVNKVLALIFQSRIDVKRMLIIGGVTLNDAFVKMLKQELKGVEVIYKDVSPVFEAFGTALLVKDSPKYTQPHLKSQKSFDYLPPLAEYQHLVKIIEEPQHKSKIDTNKEYILGVDVGSTTTKAVVVDPEDMSIIASHYGRTSGNPISATKKCINSIIKRAGNLKIKVVGVTGSGRKIVGAYFGTSFIFNEISAHSEGSTYFDSEVDTIFEIGGQDSKYMYLENGVPVDYAMNAACSAGTGSFLEESAKGDLGITVYEIADIALKAKNPVRFKADCAAFINTDIRTALQEGYKQEDIIGGLVYSIATNYLNKVKGSKRIGKKIFFQGGVAKNRSVANAFAQLTGREIVIPPNPELMGAFGIALIGKKKIDEGASELILNDTRLNDLIKGTLKHVGSFTCKACKNYCQIEQYEVDGRRFPFGGQCSKYENIRLHKDKSKEIENLVDVRSELIFGSYWKNKDKNGAIKRKKKTVGIPKALLTHSLFPLFSEFFEQLGYEVVLSDIDKEKELIINAPFCYPIQIFHGAVLDLIKKNVDWIFIPHIHTMPKGKEWLDATFCPITQASPYFVAKALSQAQSKFLMPVLEFVDGYETDTALVKMATEKLGVSRKDAEKAFKKAVTKQKSLEEQFVKLGKKALEELNAKKEIGIILVGRSYNAFPHETSLLIPKKITSMGVSVIPFDFLEKTPVDDIPWYFANYVKVAIDIVKNSQNLFLLYVTSYSCTVDNFVQNYVRSELKEKPYLILELDAHTGDAGIQTRLEAFLEIIRNYRQQEEKKKEKEFVLSKVITKRGKVFVSTSDGRVLNIKDSKIKLYFPPFSKYHIDLFTKVFELWGFNVGPSEDIKINYLAEGLKYTTGKECIPLPIVLGHLKHIVDQRQDEKNEIIGYFMIGEGSPCVAYSYFHYLEQFIIDNKMKNVFGFRFDLLTDYLGLPKLSVARYGMPAVLLADLMSEIENVLRVVGTEESLELLKRHWTDFLENTKKLKQFHKNINVLIKKIAAIPRKGDPNDYPKVLISGDFFVRFSSFFIEELKKIYAQEGIIVKSTELFEMFYYSSWSNQYVIAQRWKKDHTKLSTKLYALISSLWNHDAQLFTIEIFVPFIFRIMERRFRKKMAKTGLIFSPQIDIKSVFSHANRVISPLIIGEAITTVGKGLEVLDDSIYDALILTGPQYCLPFKISQAILKPIYLENRIPFLVFDADSSTLSPNMKRLINANIVQIKKRRKN
ncbi:MAG: acyl-CoA dehydratase activase, partial [Candidatus Heimdallarchaeaceae archaeon]